MTRYLVTSSSLLLMLLSPLWAQAPSLKQGKTLINETNYTFKSIDKRYPDHAIQEAVLHSNSLIAIGGIPFTFHAMHALSFYSNGELQAGYLAHNTNITINKVDYYLLAHRIAFYEGGMVKKGSLAKAVNMTINDTNYTFCGYIYDYDIHFHPNGMVKEGYLARRLVVNIGGVEYDFRRGRMGLYSNGVLRGGNLFEWVEVSVGGIDYLFGSYKHDYDLIFYNNGKIKSGKLARNVTVEIGNTNYTFPGDRTDGEHYITLDPHGKVIQGFVQDKGWMRWYRDGTLASKRPQTSRDPHWTGER